MDLDVAEFVLPSIDRVNAMLFRFSWRIAANQLRANEAKDEGEGDIDFYEEDPL